MLSTADAARLREFTRGPAIVCSNHPSLHEPVVVYAALDRLGVNANYLMARQTMEVMGPLKRFLQGIGVYSVRRGATDRACFAETKRLLRDGRVIVMFPEGETYGLNDELIAFHDGVTQMAFWGQAERLKDGLPGDVTLVPTFVKYHYCGDRRPAIDGALCRLEQALGLLPGDLSRYARLRAVGFAVARSLAAEFGLKLPAEASLNDYIDGLCACLIGRLGQFLDLRIPADEPLPDQLRRLLTALQAEQRPEPEAPAYRRRVQAERQPAWRALARDLRRVQTFKAVRDGYVAAHPSAERYLDLLGLLELEVLGRRRSYGWRTATLTVGEPLRLADWWETYQTDRREAVAGVTAELQARIRGLLEAAVDDTPLLDPPVEG